MRFQRALLFVCLFIGQQALALAAPPSISYWSPGKVPLGAATFRIYGSNFAANAIVKLEGMPLPTTFVSSGELAVASSAAQSGSGNVTVTNPGMPDEVSVARLVEFGAGIVLSIDPGTASVQAGAARQFTSTVSGAANNTVYWYVNGGSANGTISSSGLYRAPAAPPAGPVTIRTVSAANSERQATATVTVTPSNGISISISPTSATVQTGAARQFTATVTGSANTAVTWKVSDIVNGNATVGTVSNSGLYTAPASVPGGPIAVSATSQADPQKAATAVVTVTAGPGISVSVSPASANVQTSATRQFTAAVSGTANTAVAWQVNDVTGGDSSNGTISGSGLYTAPASVPGGAVTVRAVSQADSSRSGTASVTVTTPPVVVTISIAPVNASLAVGGTRQFAATVTGSPNTAVTWSVNNVAGGSSGAGFIDVNGLYAAPAAIPNGTITVTAASQADPTKKASANVALSDPEAVSAGRFLEQATFGPTPQSLAHLKQVGIPAWLAEQFGKPESTFPNGTATPANEMMDLFYGHFLNGDDQLRQRVLHTLSEYIVVSRNKNYYPDMLIPWIQILSRNAFGNYRTLLEELTLDASMGNYLDMVNSTKPGPSGGANENYARELMQLFSIGLYELNLDGSPVLDGNNKPIPTYTQADVRQVALALTGWTFNRNGAPPTYPNPNYYPGPMYPLPAYHDNSSKTFLGKTLAANQTMQQDIDGVIDAVFYHSNTGPFVALRLIRGLVTSNPSGEYVSRVASVFNDDGNGTRGDMKAVIAAVLTDLEARDDAAPGDFGKLRSPLLHHIAVFRALGGTISSPQQIAYVYDAMGESILNAPSVFGHFSPGYRVPGQTPPLFGPEFQINGPGEWINRGNFLWSYMSYYQTGIWDLQWLFAIGSDHNACINALDNLLLYGRMSSGLRQSLQTALQASASAGADARMRALTALYLTVMSSEYAIIH